MIFKVNIGSKFRNLLIQVSSVSSFEDIASPKHICDKSLGKTVYGQMLLDNLLLGLLVLGQLLLGYLVLEKVLVVGDGVARGESAR